jgi:aspartate carbamoyltransferase regulatory subunit
MANKISINESETIITRVEVRIVTNELLRLIEIKLGNVINHQKDWSYFKLMDVISIEQAEELSNEMFISDGLGKITIVFLENVMD